MTPETVVQLIRQTLMTTFWLAAPLLAIGFVAGLVISLVQAVTQIQEQTLTFVPKIFAMGLAVIFVMPWMFQRLIDYARTLFMMQN